MSFAEYVVIYEQAEDGGWGAYVPDLPGLGVVGETRQEAERLIREGIRVYIEELHAMGKPSPAANTFSEVVKVPA